MTETTVKAIREALEIIRQAIENELVNPQPIEESDDVTENAQPKAENDECTEISEVLEVCDNVAEEIKEIETDENIVENSKEDNAEAVGSEDNAATDDIAPDDAGDNSAELEVVNKWRAEHALSDEEFNTFSDSMRQLELAIKENSITAELLDVIYNGLHYDEDMETAHNEGEVCGRNQRIEMQRRDDIGIGASTPQESSDNVCVASNVSPLFNRATRPSVWDRK